MREITAKTAISILNSSRPKKGSYDRLQNAFDLAIKALKKQIPRKATNIKECYVPESYEVDCISCKCPVCGTSFVSGDGDDFYCYKCGQLIVFD